MQNLIIIFLSLFLFTACSSKKEVSKTSIETQIQIADYLNSSNKLQASIKEYENIYKQKETLDTVLKLAYIYRYKVKDAQSMIKWYEEAIDLDCIFCKEEVAYYFFLKDDIKNANKYKKIETKTPTKKNLNTIKHFKNRFRKKELEAGFKLAQFYLNNLNDIKNAIVWYGFSYDMGYSHSAYFLAKLYDEKLRAYDKALIWYKKSYKAGNKSARIDINRIYSQKILNLREKFNWSKKR